jgi:hypothetical protein
MLADTTDAGAPGTSIGCAMAASSRCAMRSARHRVLRPHRACQPGGDLAQHAVTDIVAMAIVDLLEAVQVDHEQRAARIA